MALPAKKKGDVVFRRIGGRVIPIRVNREQSQVAKKTAGATAIAAGAVVAERAGAKAFHFQISAARAENVARKLSSHRQGGQLNLFRTASAKRFLLKSARLHKSRNIALLAGGLIGGALAAGGAALIGDKKTEKAIGGSAGFSLAATLAGASYYARLIRPNSVNAIKHIIHLAKNRKTLQYAFKGI